MILHSKGIDTVNGLDLISMNLISCFWCKKRHIDIYRDKYGKFYVRNEGIITQKRLTAKEVVRWLSNAAQDK